MGKATQGNVMSGTERGELEGSGSFRLSRNNQGMPWKDSSRGGACLGLHCTKSIDIQPGCWGIDGGREDWSKEVMGGVLPGWRRGW